MKKGLSERQRTVITFFFLALLGCIIGWVYEMLFYRIDMGHFIKRGQGFGPWLPIYGFGALGLTFLVYKRKINPVLLFFASMIGSGIIEFATGWFCYHCLGGLRLWDYNTEIWNWGNIGGYVCFRSVLIFGIFGCLYGMFVVPKYKELIAKAKDKTLIIIASVCAVIFFADLIYGYAITPLLKVLG
ncbi:MAG: putative ABC transporter permease [Clostridiales bacterium]|nr:putative ABC transporter permease [Clostridiales bacterium]